MKLSFVDLNKSLVKKVQKLFSKNVNNPWGLELYAECGDIFDYQKKNGGKIVTASNPNFTFGGGLDAQIKMRFPEEVRVAKEFSWTDNLFFSVSVNSEIKATEKQVQRALIGVIGYREKELIISGLGTAIGGMDEKDFLKIFKNIISADLSYADLISANLRSANLSSANLSSANLSSADLRSAKNTESSIMNENTSFFALQCPEEGEFTAWKKCGKNTIVKLLITEDAKRLSGTSRKCRCSKAKVLEIFDSEGKKIKETNSNYKSSFKYIKGRIVEPEFEFDEDRWNSCGSGIYFFITRREAELYN